MAPIRGIITALITPFDDKDMVDEVALRDLVEFQVKGGVHGFFPLGTTGLGPALTPDERKQVAEIVVDQVRGRVPVMIQVGTADTPTTVTLARHAEKVGADAVAVVGPYYYKHNETELIDHYRAVGEATALPLFIYNNPRLSGVDVGPELTVRMREVIPTLAGVKVSNDSIKQHLRYLHLLPKDFTILAGFFEYLQALVPLGIKGAISPSANFFPALCRSLWDALEAGEMRQATELQERVNYASGPIWTFLIERATWGVFAEYFRACGFRVTRYPRWATRPLTEAEAAEVRQALAKAGVLPQA
jgi:4-hydroxy-tetrahydrodipicolinate synthase